MTHSGLGSSMRRRYRGPWQIRGLAAAMGGPYSANTLCQKIEQHQQCEET
ncbi:unnamed protein product [Staurois parvus]|uniref:Uncharacterized protein n=1 Tax=Staurois parvus TaxID=386267 RepID=A0ABN9BJ52_9NEOB|nr:unnamed protein product [Staurois parvus]